MNIRHKLILASSSPRRQYLLSEAGFKFKVVKPEGDESFPASMNPEEVPGYLAETKASQFLENLSDEVVITADTVVILDGQIMNKPLDRDDAIRMLTRLSGRTHLVITAVCLLSRKKKDLFSDRTDVTFKQLSQEEISFYLDQYTPYDKAGAYGAQDWLGMVGIEKINGSYFNVMGMPMHQLYEHLLRF